MLNIPIADVYTYVVYQLFVLCLKKTRNVFSLHLITTCSQPANLQLYKAHD